MTPSYRATILLLTVLLSELITSSQSQFTSGSTAQTPPPPLTEEQKRKTVEALESSLLALFGLSRRPRPSKDVVIPQYMIDLYRIQSGDTDTPIPDVFSRTPTAKPANTIRSFFHEDDTDLFDCSTENCARLWFNVTYIPQKEVLTDAELRVYIERNYTHEPDPDKVIKHKLQVFEIMKPVSKDEDSISRLIDVQDIVVKNSSWVSLDVHPAVLKWKNRPRSNHGLEIRVVPHRNNFNSNPLKHVRLRRATEVEESEWNIQRPLLVTYTDDGKAKSLSRTKRNSDNETEEENDVEESGDIEKNKKKKKRKRKKCPKGEKGKKCRKRRKEKRERKKNRKNKKKDKNNKTKENPPGKERPGHENLCQKRPLYVDFHDVQWNDWIVAPLGYDAYYCDGNCPFPLSDNLNTTNHAIVQTLVNSVDARAAPTACCVPTALSSLSMLYLDEHDKVILKNYDDMVVQGCGCR